MPSCILHMCKDLLSLVPAVYGVSTVEGAGKYGGMADTGKATDVHQNILSSCLSCTKLVHRLRRIQNSLSIQPQMTATQMA